MKKKLYRCISLMLALCLLFLAGCGTDTAFSEDDEGTDLLVYYVKDHPYFGTALGSYIYSHSKDYNITLQPFETDEEMCNRLATEIAAGQGPDIILMTSDSSFDIYKAAQSGNLADLSSYFEKDEEFSSEDYYKPVLDGGVVAGGQYLVPFCFRMETMYVNQKVLEEAGMTAESVNNFETMVSLFHTACESADEETLGIVLARNVNDGSPKATVTAWLGASGIPIVSEDGKVADQIEQILGVEEFMTLVQEEYDGKPEVYQRWSTQDGLLVALCQMNYGPGIYHLLQADYMTDNNEAGDTYVWMPCPNADGQPQPQACYYGIVNKNSKSKQAAYELLRYFMDYDCGIQYIGGPLPVSRSMMDKKLTTLQNMETEWGDFNLPKLSDEQRMEFEAVLDNMATATVYNTGYYDIVCDRFRDFWTGEGEKEAVLENIKAELERYLRE